MKRIKALGLGVATALALMTAVGAGSASAAGFAADLYPATILSKPSSEFSLKTNGGKVACDGVSLSGLFNSPRETYPGSEWAASDCQGIPFALNGCQLIFRPGSETSPGQFGGTFDIGPAGCGPASITLPSPFNCKVTIGAQSGLKATYKNVGVGVNAAVAIDIVVLNLKYTQEKTKTNGCTNGTFENGEYIGSWLAKGLNAGGGLTGIRVLDLSLGIVGKESEEKAAQPRFEGTLYPVLLGGSQVTGQELKFDTTAGRITCGSVQFNGEVSGATTALAFQPQFAKCTAFGTLTAVPVTNGCEFVFNVLNVGPPYAGDADIVCPEGKSLTFIAQNASEKTKCTITVPSQSGLGGVTFTNTAGGFGIQVGLSLSGIDYQQLKGEGIGACASGSFENGLLKGAIGLLGYQ